MSQDIQAKLRASGIPPQAYLTTLQNQRQALLRSIITDRAFQSRGDLKSIAIHQPTPMPTDRFSTIVARFAAELALVGPPVHYVRTAGLRRQLQRHAVGADAELSHEGFLVVSDFAYGAAEGDMLPDVCDYLMSHVAHGGGLVLGLYGDAPKNRMPDFDCMVATFMQVFPSTDPALKAA